MKIFAYESFWKLYSRLPTHIQKKADRQIKRLVQNPLHPSLHTKKIQGTLSIWEARVDLSYRMSFERKGDLICLRAIGNHDEVLERP